MDKYIFDLIKSSEKPKEQFKIRIEQEQALQAKKKFTLSEIIKKSAQLRLENSTDDKEKDITYDVGNLPGALNDKAQEILKNLGIDEIPLPHSNDFNEILSGMQFRFQFGMFPLELYGAKIETSEQEIADITKSFLDTYNKLIPLTAFSNPYRGLKSHPERERGSVWPILSELFNGAVDCAFHLRAAGKNIDNEFKYSLHTDNNSYEFNLTFKEIELTSDHEIKSYYDVCSPLRQVEAGTEEGIVSNGKVAIAVTVERSKV